MIRPAAERLEDPDLSSAERLEAARELLGGTPDLDAVCEVDLHLHSFCSDGYPSPAARVVEAWRRRLRAIALADHETFDGCAEAIAAGRLAGVDLVPAIEFYTDRPGVEILGFWPDAERFLAWRGQGGGEATISLLREARGRQLAAMVARVPACFANRGFAAEITPEDIRRHVRNGISSKGDLSVILWQKYGPELARLGIVSDVKDLQARITTRADGLDVPLDCPLDLSPTAVVRRVLDWGGLPGLSHPTELRTKERLGNDALRALIFELAGEGLQAVEVDGWRNRICPECGRPQTEVFAGFVAEWNALHPERPLLTTNGSDDHAQPGERLEMGCGRNRNLRPEWGRYASVLALRERAATLAKRGKGDDLSRATG